MPLDKQTQALIATIKQGGFKPARQIPVEASRARLNQMAVSMAGVHPLYHIKSGNQVIAYASPQ